MTEGIEVPNLLKQSPTRSAILGFLRDAKEPHTVKDIAVLIGIHPNVARTHLSKLVDAGFVSESLLRNNEGGRPSKIYRANEFFGDVAMTEHGAQLASSADFVIRLLVEIAKCENHDPLEQRAWSSAQEIAKEKFKSLPLNGSSIGDIAKAIVNGFSAIAPDISLGVITEQWADIHGLNTMVNPLSAHDKALSEVVLRGLLVGAGNGLNSRIEIDNSTGREGVVRIRRAANRNQYATKQSQRALDTRGLDRDESVVRAMSVMTELHKGDILEVFCEGAGSPGAFAKWADRAGHALLSVERAQDSKGKTAIRLLFEKG